MASSYKRVIHIKIIIIVVNTIEDITEYLMKIIINVLSPLHDKV